MRRWIQKKPPQLSMYDAAAIISNNEQVIPNSTHTRSNEVHQTSMNSMHYTLTGQMEATSNGYHATNFTTAQPMSARNGFSGVENVTMTAPNVEAVHSSAHRVFTNEAGAGQNELLDDVSIVTKSVTDDIMAMFGDPTLQTESRPPREYSSLPPAHQDVFKTGRAYTNESSAGVGRADDITMNTKSVTDDIMAMFSSPQNVSQTGNSYSNMLGTELSGRVIDDVTIDTKSVTDDIMAMFRGSPAPRARGQTTQNNVSYIGTPSQSGGLRAPVVLSPPVGKLANTSIMHNSPSAASPSDSESRTLNARVDYKLATMQQQPRQNAAEGSKSEVSAWDSGSQVLQNGATTLQTREVVSVRKDGISNQKHMESATVGQWVTKETRSSIILESSKPEVSVIHDLSSGKRRLIKEDSSYDERNVRSTPSRKRSSWSTSAKGTQCIYISDEDEKVDSRENKKRRASITSNDGPGVKDSRTPVLERSLAMREKQHPSQYSPLVGFAPTKNVASPKEDTIVPR